VKVAVTGSTGLIGGALVAQLRAGGHEVVALVRRPARSSGEVEWDPQGGSVDVAGLAGVDGAVHLAGAGVGDRRWDDSYKRMIRESRTVGTRTLVNALTSLDPQPQVLVVPTAIGYYGDRGDEEVTEDSPPGDGFLAGVVRDWEAESQVAAAHGIRVVNPRTGLVLAPHGGALGRLMPLLRLGLGGRLGNGRQWWSWITLEDEVRGLLFALEHDLAGPVNLTAPEPARNADVIRALGRAVGRPTILPVPSFALRAVIGEFAGEILDGQKVLPKRLLAAGFRFQHPDLDTAARWVARRD
jgi:uncharacterized protein